MITLYPTDTIYGLGVDATDPGAIRRLQELKGSGAEKHYSIAVLDIDMMRQYAEVTPLAERLAAKFLPGKLTLVLAAKNLPKEIAPDGSIGIRIPDHKAVQELILKIGGPITATSANVSGMQPESTVEKILEQFGPKASGIIYDTAISPVLSPSAPSTVVDARGDKLVLIREGAITWSELQNL